MKSATQQCKNERTSFFRDGVDLLCYRDNINDLEGCSGNQQIQFDTL